MTNYHVNDLSRHQQSISRKCIVVHKIVCIFALLFYKK